MGNQISQQLQNDYQQYMESSNEILTDMVANLSSKSLQEIGKLSNIGGRNSQALYFISYIVHLLYGNDVSLIPPFGPPNKDANMVGQFCYDMKLVSHLRKILSNEDNNDDDAMDVDKTPGASNMEEIMFRNYITYLELTKVIKSILEKYNTLEFSGKNNDMVFDYNSVDSKPRLKLKNSSLSRSNSREIVQVNPLCSVESGNRNGSMPKHSRRTIKPFCTKRKSIDTSKPKSQKGLIRTRTNDTL